MSYDENQDRAMYIVGLVIAGLFLVAGIVFYINGDFLKSVMPGCFLYRMTGFYCPGCGATRATYAFFRGRIITSLFYNAFVPYTAIAGGWFIISQTIQRLCRGRCKIGMHFRAIYAYIGVGLLLLNCIIKNLIIIIGHTHVM